MLQTLASVAICGADDALLTTALEAMRARSLAGGGWGGPHNPPLPGRVWDRSMGG